MSVVLASLVLVGVVCGGLVQVNADCQQLREFLRCNDKVYKYNREHPLKNTTELACHDIQIMSTCIASDPCCKGPIIEAVRYLVYANAVVVKKVLCPQLEYEALKKLAAKLAKKLHLPRIDDKRIDECFKLAYMKCSKEFAEDLKKLHDICLIFRSGIKRLEKVECPKSVIFPTYYKIQKTLASQIIDQAMSQHLCKQ